ncbi:MAG: hypothetical protein KF834_08645 [Burkholderiales bacterium]|nr:hypothetical protein [Burkholderiales bacterium]
MLTRYFVIISWCLFFAGAVHAFEVKGYTPGMDVSMLDLKSCRAIPDADSGIPGYACDTTVGGDPAVARLLVFGGKLIGAVFNLKNAHMRPVLDALTEKYGIKGAGLESRSKGPGSNLDS